MVYYQCTFDPIRPFAPIHGCILADHPRGKLRVFPGHLERLGIAWRNECQVRQVGDLGFGLTDSSWKPDVSQRTMTMTILIPQSPRIKMFLVVGSRT